MRSHVFPVCRPSFESVEVDVNELSQVPRESSSDTWYSNESGSQVFTYRLVPTQDIDEFQIRLVAEKLVSEILFSESVTSLTEVLELVKGDSVGDTTFGLVFYYFLFSYANSSDYVNLSNAFYNIIQAPNALYYEQEEDTPPGFVVCIGIKNAKDVRDKVKETGPDRAAHIIASSFAVNGNLSGDEPFEPNSGSFHVDTLVNNMFATFMYTGTRWVLLGSNNWIS